MTAEAASVLGADAWANAVTVLAGGRAVAGAAVPVQAEPGSDAAAAAGQLARRLGLPAGATARRRQEFVAGREAARQALQLLTGVEAAAPRRAPHGRACWPDGVTGSITHSPTLALAVVGYGTGTGTGLGLDLEPLSSAAALHRGRHLFATRAERARLECTPWCDVAALVLFSAKEAAFKALPAGLQAGLAARELVVTERPAVRDEFRATAHLAGVALQIRSVRRGGHVLTVACAFGDTTVVA